MNKEKIKEKIIKDGKELYLSAQDYDLMNLADRALIKEILKDEKLDSDEYDKKMKKLWPRSFTPKPLVWRDR